jgi:hypothetical protein
VLGKEHGKEPKRWNHPDEAGFLVDHGQGRLSVPNGVPRSPFLVNAGRDYWSVSVHERLDSRVAGRSMQIFDGDDSGESCTATDHEMARAFVGSVG